MDQDNLDEHQDVARSSYADMLHDDERNHAYNEAIRANVYNFVKSQKLNPDGNRFYKCCDIGTGSGLLSMMIVRCFRELNYKHFHVTSFEAFKPMAECARKIIEANEMSDSITVIPTRSEEYSGQNPQFDLLVAELLDTELIGEGCLETYRHANQKLCSPDCVFIPQQANIYIQMIECDYYIKRHLLREQNLVDNDQKVFCRIQVPSHISDCCGMPEIDDLQTLSVTGVTRYSEPEIVFHFNFCDINSLKLRNSNCIKNSLYIKGSNDRNDVCILMWWDIVMYDKSLFKQYISAENVNQTLPFDTLSCQPSWFRGGYKERDEYIRATYGRDIWREHWIRGIYYLPPGAGTTSTIYAYHDSHSMWFQTEPLDKKLPNSCRCGVHRMLSRPELAFLNNTEGHLAKLITNLMGKHQSLSSNKQLEATIQFNLVAEVSAPKWEIKFEGSETKLLDYSLQADLSWGEILSRYLDGQSIEPIIDVEIFYSHVSFKNLSRIRDKIRVCQGFDLTHLDDLISKSSRVVDNPVESHFLWEYESTLVGQGSHCLCSMKQLARQTENGETDFKLSRTIQVSIGPGKGQALVFWCKFIINREPLECISTGPVYCETMREMEPIEWSKNYKQLVYFVDSDSNGVEVSPTLFDVELTRRDLRIHKNNNNRC